MISVNRLFNYFNKMPWAKPLTMLIVINDIVLMWALLFTSSYGIRLDPILRDVILGVTGFVLSGNFTKSYLEHKLMVKSEEEPHGKD